MTKQDYGTPPEFIKAVEQRFGPLFWDLAAYDDGSNAVAPNWFGPIQDSLSMPWASLGDKCVYGFSEERAYAVLWLNPPYANCHEWAAKCAREAELGARILMLTPAAVDSNWFADHVHNKAMVLGLSPRLTFVGCSTPYPKPLMLSCFGFGVAGFAPWRWGKPARKRKVAPCLQP